MGAVPVQHAVLVTGWTGAGKSTIANEIATRLGCTVASFDWLMSGLRAFPDLWSVVELPAEMQRTVGWTLQRRVAEQELRRGASVVFDLVAREQPREDWLSLAESYGAAFTVVECICSDRQLHRERVDGRSRSIPDWYELSWDRVSRGRDAYVPLAEPKLIVDAVDPLDRNVDAVMAYIAERGR